MRELCDLLGVASPRPIAALDYMFERPITFAHGDGSSSAGRIDCYKHSHFVLEAKKIRLEANANDKGHGSACSKNCMTNSMPLYWKPMGGAT